VPVVRTAPERPAQRLATSEGAARLTWRGLPRTDLAVLVHAGTNRVPGFAVRPTLDLLAGPRVTVTPVYRRRTALGATFETALTDPFVLRGEAAWESRAFLPERPPAPFDPAFADALERGFLVERPQVQAALTAERVFGAHLVRVTGLGRWVLDHDARVAAEAFQPALVGLWNGAFRRQTLTARVLVFWNVGADGWANPSLTYALRDALEVEAGAQVFEAFGAAADGPFPGLGASPSAAFALYDANDLVYARLRYSF
jgi:hypothetical protein